MIGFLKQSLGAISFLHFFLHPIVSKQWSNDLIFHLLPNELFIPGFLIGQGLDSMIKFQIGNFRVHIRSLWPSSIQ